MLKNIQGHWVQKGPKKGVGKLPWVHTVELHDNDEGKRPKHDPLSPH